MGDLKEAIYKFVSLLLYCSGFCYFLKFINRKKIRVLMYHGVDNGRTEFNSDDPSIVISTENFEKQIKYLSKYYKIISMQDLINHIKKKIPFESNSAVVTFDDGLKNNFTRAFPILYKYDIKATVFLIAEYIDSLKINWLNKFFYILKKINLGEIIEEFKKEFPSYSNLNGYNGQDNLIEYIKFILKYKVDDSDRAKFIDRLYDKFKIEIDKDKTENLYLSWKDIKKMSDKGISFGCHTSTHPVLSVLNYEEAEKEIIDSKQNIEAELKKEINLFAYPYGEKDSFNLNNKKILAKHNFLSAVSTIDGLNDLDSDLFEIKRIPIADEPFYCFKLRIEGFEGSVKKKYRMLSKYFKKEIF